jgi:hypothetical protein
VGCRRLTGRNGGGGGEVRRHTGAARRWRVGRGLVELDAEEAGGSDASESKMGDSRSHDGRAAGSRAPTTARRAYRALGRPFCGCPG